MKFWIKHEIKGRIRIHIDRKKLSFKEADTLEYYLENLPGVTKAKVYERTADAAVTYEGSREELILSVRQFRFENTRVPDIVFESSDREMNAFYRDKIITKIMIRYSKKLFLPMPVRAVINIIKASKFIVKGIKSLAAGRVDVAVLDAAAITVSILRGDTATAGAVMFLLGIGDVMEEWTHKKSVKDLAKSMALKAEKVWLKTNGTEILMPVDKIQAGDIISVRMGSVIPFDGTVTGGEGMVNESTMTGESIPAAKEAGASVYAGTVLEEGALEIKVRSVGGDSRYERIISIIEETEKLKSETESRTEHLADRLVPYTLAGTGLVGICTRSAAKTASVLMVDFSCALKLSMPITVLSAIREAGQRNITVKGGKFIEAVAEAETIVFDKTGTLTHARPEVKKVVPFCRKSQNELLRIAACLEEHYPHSVAGAVVRAAEEKGLVHEEMHAKIEYVVAHGISSYIDDKRVVIGSRHFIFEDEGCRITPAQQKKLDAIPEQYSRLFMAVDNKLAAVICIEDSVRAEARDAISKLYEAGFKKVVMMTGDNEKSAAAVAAELGIDEYYAEVLPEQKAEFIRKEKMLGRKVVMVGDGINDSPALSAADAGIAISSGADIAREIADITISADDLYSLITLKELCAAMMKRVRRNYRLIVGINGLLIVLGLGGIIQSSTSAALHNLSTIGISLASMKPLLPQEVKN